MSMYVLVNLAELIQAASDMNKAMEVYDEAVEAAKNTAADLAEKWEGAAKDAFVVHQENAYKWYKEMLDIVMRMIREIQNAAESYRNTEAIVENIVRGK